MPKSLLRCAFLGLALVLGVSACGADEAGSPPAAINSSTTVTSTTGPVALNDDANISEPTDTTSVPADADISEDDDDGDALPFADNDTVEQQVWADVEAVSFATTFNDDVDGPAEIIGNYVAGEGLVLLFPDPLEGNVLAVVRDGQIGRAFRVGNEVFVDAPLEETANVHFFASVLARLIEPLGTGNISEVTGTFVTVDGVPPSPDVLYQLPEGTDEGVIWLGGNEIRVTNESGAGAVETPEFGVMLTREQVGNTANPIFRDWYLDQAG